MEPAKHFPFEMIDLEESIESKLLSYFTGISMGMIRVGPKGYVLPTEYKKYAGKIYNMPVRSNDVFVVTYPRSGTTLTQELVWLVANNLDYKTAKETALTFRHPFIESQILMPESEAENNDAPVSFPGIDQIIAMPSPRFIKSHLPLSLLPPALADTAKVVYVARDPRDVAVSCYHLSRRLKFEGFIGDFPTYWDFFRRDLITFTPVWDHMKEAWAARHNPNMLFVFYEDLVKDMPSEIRKVAKFFSKTLTDEQILGLCQHLHIGSFRTNKTVNPEIELHQKQMLVDGEEPFVRKGGSGGWREYFDKQMTEEADKWIADNLRGTDLKFPFTKNQ